jgi:hypothetical protein
MNSNAALDKLTAFDYARLKAEIRSRYASGDVVVHDGWILSSTEYRMFVAEAPRPGFEADAALKAGPTR